MSNRYMFTLRRGASSFLYLICLIFAVGCFYFSLSESIFSWYFPDELVASQAYHNLGGLFACVKYYYFSTSINRLSADFSTCLMAQGATWFSSPLIGWMMDRLVFYTLIPISVAFFLKEICKIPFKFGLLAALIISTGVFYLLVTTSSGSMGPYMYGVDLTIYGTATFTFFMLAAIFSKSIEDNRYFKWLCLVYAINLMSHEVFLVISGFFIPLYAWYAYTAKQPSGNSFSFNAFIKNAVKNKPLWILLIIYVISALIDSLAHGVSLRQQMWTPNGTFFDGIVHVFLVLEETIYFISTFYVYGIMVFFLGVLFSFVTPNTVTANRRLLYLLVMTAPLVYLIIVGYLLGISPSLLATAIRPQSFHWIEPWVSSLVNKDMLVKGAICTCRILFLYIGLFLDIFLAGFLLSRLIFKKYVKIRPIKIISPFTFALLLLLISIFLLHPDGVGSVRLLLTLLKPAMDFSHYSPQENYQAHPEMAMIYRISPSFKMMQPFNDQLFPKKLYQANGITGGHQSDIIAIMVDHYLKSNRNKGVSDATMALVYQSMDSRIQYDIELWRKITYEMYHVFAPQPCISLSNEATPNSICHQTYGQKALSQLLVHKKLTAPPVKVSFNQAQNVEIKPPLADCLPVVDVPGKGEHFIASSTLTLSQGLNYFIFETKPTRTQLYLYIIGEKQNLLLPWLNVFNALAGWSSFDKNDTIRPVFSQTESTPSAEKLKVVIYSAMPQQVHLRWQHGYNNSTIFNDKKRYSSSICKAQFGQLVESK